jgi:hypothetical protein
MAARQQHRQIGNMMMMMMSSTDTAHCIMQVWQTYRSLRYLREIEFPGISLNPYQVFTVPAAAIIDCLSAPEWLAII